MDTRYGAPDISTAAALPGPKETLPGAAIDKSPCNWNIMSWGFV